MKTWTFPELHPEPGGPWDDEPDKAQWIDEATGYDCLIVRNIYTGALCGYVGLPPGHPLHGAGYERLDVDVDVHGGLTFTAPDGAPAAHHVPEPGRPTNLWWLGFDCAHAGDLMPRHLKLYEVEAPNLLASSVYRPWAYVQAEVTSLAKQLAAATL